MKLAGCFALVVAVAIITEAAPAYVVRSELSSDAGSTGLSSVALPAVIKQQHTERTATPHVSPDEISTSARASGFHKQPLEVLQTRGLTPTVGILANAGEVMIKGGEVTKEANSKLLSTELDDRLAFLNRAEITPSPNSAFTTYVRPQTSIAGESSGRKPLPFDLNKPAPLGDAEPHVYGMDDVSTSPETRFDSQAADESIDAIGAGRWSNAASPKQRTEELGSSSDKRLAPRANIGKKPRKSSALTPFSGSTSSRTQPAKPRAFDDGKEPPKFWADGLLPQNLLERALQQRAYNHAVWRAKRVNKKVSWKIDDPRWTEDEVNEAVRAYRQPGEKRLPLLPPRTFPPNAST